LTGVGILLRLCRRIRAGVRAGLVSAARNPKSEIDMGLYSKYIFPRLLDWGLGDSITQSQRREALASVRGNVLEVGFGTGLNLPHYPKHLTKLTAVEPVRMLEDRVERRIAEAGMPVEQIHLDASGRLPLDDESFDFVVTTFTLCSISDVAGALGEMRRVLKPEGRYVFLEHGRSDDPRVAKRQDFFNPVQRIIACGCNINRAIDRLIRESGFHVTELDRYVMPGTPRMLGEMYRGSARKTGGRAG
jgi:ubiquinone/menaquinone biosynthesis C-methylase UbiE